MPKTPDHLTRRMLISAAVLSAAVAPLARAAESNAAQQPSPNLAMSPSEQLLHATVRIVCYEQQGSVATGTGFFFSLFHSGSTNMPVLVTNKHVVNGSTKGLIRLTLQKEDGSPDLGNFKDVVIPNFPSQWVPHPDPDVDLTIMPAAGFLNSLISTGSKPFFVQLDPTLIPTPDELTELTSLEDVLVIGYPDGISDPRHNIPIFRRGITATPVYIDFDGKQEFLIDAAIFPGSSGSPVMLYNAGSYAAHGGLIMGTRVKLLGIVHAVMLNGVNGEITIIPAPTQSRAVVTSQMPNNLGLCLRSSRILEFEPLLVQMGVKPPDGYTMRAQSTSK